MNLYTVNYNIFYKFNKTYIIISVIFVIRKQHATAVVVISSNTVCKQFFKLHSRPKANCYSILLALHAK